jgi:uncharacterized protein (DUF433 family)
VVEKVAATERTELWRERLTLPAYLVGEAARYADISPQTVSAWHKVEKKVLSKKDTGVKLSYLQLIEMAVVAAFRKAKVPLKEIRAARDYMRKQLNSKYPFAEYKFKLYGKSLFTTYVDSGHPHLLKANQAGQLGWEEILGPVLKEFEYDDSGGVAVRWHVAGEHSPVVIDPRISFGAPSVNGTPTWIIKGRFEAGESDSEIAEDFSLDVPTVREALKFEGLRGSSKSKWMH